MFKSSFKFPGDFKFYNSKAERAKTVPYTYCRGVGRMGETRTVTKTTMGPLGKNCSSHLEASRDL